ncbi:MAG TPA: efflux RND transporter periplasmic adaptor subunit [Verrucomicrobiae bacterium]|nr:efflux RND transporter periplasmic adaptor subunit [Verrucomicrobiae bacterium]
MPRTPKPIANRPQAASLPHSKTMLAALCISLTFFLSACEKKATAESDPSATGPVPTKVQPDMDSSHFKVDHPEQFPLVTAGEHTAAPELNVTGVVSPDVSRQVPAPSLATGRVVEVDARLGDTVQKGQLLFKVRSTDIAGAYSDYQKAIKNEQLARIQLNRAKILFDDGAIPKSQLEVAQNAEDNAQVDVTTAMEHLKLLGSDPDHPSGIVEVYAPVAGVVTDQQITASSGVQALTAPNPFTISDISHVWIVCDVYENNMAQVHLDDYADIHLAAYPDRVLRGRISNIAPIVDPALRTAKVRLEVDNPGLMRLGMFVTATFHGQTAEKRATVPASAVLHLHDREWVYVPLGDGSFKQVEVVSGAMLPDNLQEIVSGIKPGDRVVSSALVFQNTVEQ